MWYPFLKAVHFISLALLLAAPAFLWWIWGPAAREGSPGGGHPYGLARRMRPAAALGALLFAASGIGDALRAASQIFPLTDFELVRLFFTGTQYGRLTAAKIAAVLAWCLFFFLAGGGRRRVFVPLCGLASLVLVYTVSGASHAAAKPGLVPLVSDMVHVLASGIWSGGLFYLAAFAPREAGRDGLEGFRFLYVLIERFSTAALIAVGAVVATGAFATYLHVYDANAVVSTPYGRSLAVKIGLFLAGVGAAGYNLMVAAPALRRGLVRRDRAALAGAAARFAAAVKLEAAAVAGVLIAAGVLTTLPPADTPGTVLAGTWVRSAQGITTTVELAPRDEPGGLFISVLVQRDDGEPAGDGARMELLLEMTSHRMAVGPLVPQRVAPGRYEAETRLPMDGEWRMTVRVEEPGQEPAATQFLFDAAAGSMMSGRVRRLELSGAVRTPGRRFVTALGLVLLALGIWAVAGGHRRRFALSAIPLGLAMMALGGYHLLSTTLTDSIPTRYVPNPVPYTLEAVRQGAAIYAQHCAMCHGPEGRGDGVLAASLDPPPADLTADHVDDHTDGDIFWWVTYGIEQTAMPALGNVLSEEERWTVIHFVRSLRHFAPALQEDPGGGGETSW